MKIFKKLIKTTMDVATTPIAIVSDTLTCFGAATETESELKKKAEQISNDWEEIREELSK